MTTRFKLNTGSEIPAIGFGTWQDKESQESAVAEAIKAGYRHIDTARVYCTEKPVGRGIAKSGVPRKDLFVTTKLWCNKHHPDDVADGLQQSLDDLGLDYVDLYLMHWPVAWKRGEELFPKKNNQPILENIDIVDTYKAMEKLLETGKTKAIGVSNFSKLEMERLVKEVSVIPAVHQMECHPYLQQEEFTAWHKAKGIHVTHYSPFGNQNTLYSDKPGIGKLIEDPVLVEIGKQYGKSAAQVALAWGVTQGHSVLPKSKTPSRIKSNLEGDFRLSEKDTEKIRTINKKTRFNDSSEVEIIRFHSPGILTADSLHNIHVEFLDNAFEGPLQLVYGECDMQHHWQAHHELTATFTFVKREAHPERFVWVTPLHAPHAYCLHVFSGSSLLGRSSPISVSTPILKRESIADVADAMGSWVDGIAYMKSKENSEAVVSKAKNTSVAILGGGMSGLVTSHLLESVGIHDWHIYESSERVVGVFGPNT
ncbi:hypothetical protein PENDEC_c002G02423 [Penicillium decumbens]|uniref:D-xylose reductase [NAD(P)H] n=1 Tax=Penicillium decumbens TaxID=69771 RepID=A0A1V6PLA7_PENDC|nr:hypothetical protein PENDEC_c002G02423 [Penicillium decumbens]